MTDATLTSWIDVPAGHDFPLANVPFGIFSTSDRSARPGMRVGDHVVDLSACHALGFLNGVEVNAEVLAAPVLNQLMKLGKPVTVSLRERVQTLLREDCPDLRDRNDAHASCLVSMDEVQMHMPVEVGDNTDFYSSEDHARNVGKMFRDPDNALLPNWKHMPVGYHGRASSIVVSGTPIRRPMGQTRPDPEAPPVFGPSRLLDFELEMAFITFEGKPMGERITTAKPRTTSLGWCSSTTGLHATSKSGSTCPSVRSWAKISARPFHPGWSRWRLWTTCGLPVPARILRCWTT